MVLCATMGRYWSHYVGMCDALWRWCVKCFRALFVAVCCWLHWTDSAIHRARLRNEPFSYKCFHTHAARGTSKRDKATACDAATVLASVDIDSTQQNSIVLKPERDSKNWKKKGK